MSKFSPLGVDLFGEEIKQVGLGPLARRYLVPPFSVLDARAGEWQERKRAWVALGIEGEINPKGRDSGLTHNTADWFTAHGKSGGDNTTSIFDPVLCELVYEWFCPPGGQVVDPFAGGSVRGIVAAMLGRKYWGCDLRQEQIEANEEQRAAIMPTAGYIPIKISGASLRQKFQPCEPEYITNVCRGRCCEGTDRILVTVHPSERTHIESLGAQVDGSFVVADSRGLCPFKNDSGLCSVHDKGKPFGCRASPFTLNHNNTLIVRNRYRLLRCYDTADAVPAYKAHAWSLAQIFGEGEAGRISGLAAGGADTIEAVLDVKTYAMLRDNDDAKHGETTERVRPNLEWVCGDALEALGAAPEADLVFSCPPYGDLERYSDDPRDLSTMEYHTFLPQMRRVIMRCAKCLKNNRFAAFVVGDFRDRRTGLYRGFMADTIVAFRDMGMALYNDAVLLTAIGSLPIRAGKQFDTSRKLGKTHQNLLVFVKGDARKAAEGARGRL